MWRMRERCMNTGYFSIRKITPLNPSCHARAIIPGRRLFGRHAEEPKKLIENFDSNGA